MIKRTFEIWQDDRPIVRIGTDNEKAELEFRRYGSWEGHELLTRETVLEIRDTMDAVLQSWFCPPIRLDPSQVAELAAGRASNLGAYSPDHTNLPGLDATTFIPCEVDRTHEDPDVALYGQSTEDEIEMARRTT